jgi:hypothetical protein
MSVVMFRVSLGGSADLQEADSLLTRRACEVDKLVDGVFGWFGHDCKGAFAPEKDASINGQA